MGADTFPDPAVAQPAGEVTNEGELADSGDLQPGGPAIAIASPAGVFKGTATVRVLSTVDRRARVMQWPRMEGLIQPDV